MHATKLITVKADRFKAFADAVVAIAMTLLILPLMESVSEAGRHQHENPGYDTAAFLHEHVGQIVSLMLSFLLIAVFWMGHHQQYDAIERITKPLLWLNIAWMFTIVCLPVTTALLGAMDTDPLQKVVYIGNLALTQLTGMLARIYVLRHPELTTAPLGRVRLGAIADATTTVLYMAALGLSLLWPRLSYGTLFVLMLTSVVTHLAARHIPGASAPIDDE